MSSFKTSTATTTAFPSSSTSPSLTATPSSAFTSTDPSPALSAFDPPSHGNHQDLEPLDEEIDAYEREYGVSAAENKEASATLIEAWGHRGASATFPENTMASFTATCAAGADGIETDLHITRDGRLVCFHDPELGRTTDGRGKIHEANWRDELEHVRTLEKPSQPIPLFDQVIDLLMRPENAHVKLNIDCKVENKPDVLFPKIKESMARYVGWEGELAPRIVLGIWHPSFIAPAKQHLPEVTLYCIVMDIHLARRYFFPYVAGFSVNFAALLSVDGARFRREAATAGKRITAWTVNREDEMRECIKWGVQAVITDVPEVAVRIRSDAKANPTSLDQDGVLGRMLMPWTDLKYWFFHKVKNERPLSCCLQSLC